MTERVTVVGAGPAGATAARALALAGVPVRLLDRSSFPRNKPCGGGISLRALARFPYLERALPRIATHTVSRIHLEGPDGDETTIDAGGPVALMIRRVEFDALLVDLAVEAGAELVTGVDVVSAEETAGGVRLTSRDGRAFDAPLIVAADGVHSVVARRLGLNTGWKASAVAIDMMEETPRTRLRDVDPSMLWVAYGYVPEGYAYVFPKRDHVNIGIGSVLGDFRRSRSEAPYDLQRRFVDHLRSRAIVEGESAREHFTPFLIPVGGPLPRLGRGRVLLAGDAGGFVNAFTAEGIYYAMVSGELAARTIATTPPMRMGTVARRYQRACDREIGAELRDSVLIQQFLFRDRRRIGALIRAAGRPGAPAGLLVDYVVGRTSGYGALRRRLLTRAPRLALHMVGQLARTRTPGGLGN